MEGVTKQVEQYYRSLLSKMQSGERLPSERSVMAELNSCRTTIRMVLVKLAAEGHLYPVHGKGYFKL